ncbi:EMP24/GP25L/P24_family/GOLD family protein [Hexamita inflata]|uniref:EMP24/GP25L/P24_family/GOLD family protein n=1 Tax=Hexamita inflata TaxID=28002 RepID=A0ABP1GG47_9EUKA
MLSLLLTLQYSINIKGDESFCFTQKTVEKSQLSVTFYAVEGGSLTVSASIAQVDGNQVDRKENVPSGSFYINSTVTGTYKICLINSEQSQKQITFFVQYTELTVEKQEADDLGSQLLSIQTKMTEVHQFQRQSQQIERRLKTIMTQIKSSVSQWTAIKFVVILLCAAYQIWTFKKFFSKKRTAV